MSLKKILRAQRFSYQLVWLIKLFYWWCSLFSIKLYFFSRLSLFLSVATEFLYINQKSRFLGIFRCVVQKWGKNTWYVSVRVVSLYSNLTWSNSTLRFFANNNFKNPVLFLPAKIWTECPFFWIKLHSRENLVSISFQFTFLNCLINLSLKSLLQETNQTESRRKSAFTFLCRLTLISFKQKFTFTISSYLLFLFITTTKLTAFSCVG
jgi:hypothetical protein